MLLYHHIYTWLRPYFGHTAHPNGRLFQIIPSVSIAGIAITLFTKRLNRVKTADISHQVHPADHVRRESSEAAIVEQC